MLHVVGGIMLLSRVSLYEVCVVPGVLGVQFAELLKQVGFELYFFALDATYHAIS